jgi:hypothetical protein
MKSKAFQKPTIEEVEAFMNERKPEWPAAFSRFYAEKFWNSYEKSGWRLSAGRGGPVKSWKACFSSNWQDVSFASDRETLNRMVNEEIVRAKMSPASGGERLIEITPDALDTLMERYTASPTRVSQSLLAGSYDWIKSKIKVRLSREQRDIVLGLADKDVEKAKATVVGWVFESLAKEGKTFKQLIATA